MRLTGSVWLLCVLSASQCHERATTSATGSSPSIRTSRSATCFSSLVFHPMGEELDWEVGSVYEVACRVTNSSSSSSSSSSVSRSSHNLTLYRGGSTLPSQAVNRSTVVARINQTAPESYKLVCVDSSTNHFCMKQVKAGYPALDVEDLQCVSKNWQTFACSWTIPENPLQQEYKPYLITSLDPSVECGCETLASQWCGCPNTCCEWSQPKYVPVDPFVTVMFNVPNALGTNDFLHNISNYAVVLPDELEAAVQQVPGERAAAVSWTLKAPMQSFARVAGVIVRADHRLVSEGGEAPPWIKGESRWCNSSSCKTGEQLLPLEHWWQTFEVRVRVRSGAANQTQEEDGWWSPWTARRVQTPPAAPEVAPEVGPGTFQVTDRGYPDLHDLTLTWQRLPALQHNGPNLIYLAQIFSDNQRSQVVAQANVTDNFMMFSNLSSLTTYTMRVAALNSEGGGPGAELRVEQARPAPPLLPVVITHTIPPHETLYELRWSLPEQAGAPAAERYTVYLCTGEQEGDQPCTGQLTWSRPEAVKGSVNVTLETFGVSWGSAPQVTFAVSGETEGGASSGLSWARCPAPQPYNPDPGPPTLRNTSPGSSGVVVSWSLSCSNRAGVVEVVEAACCPGQHDLPENCTGPLKKVEAEVWPEVVEVEGLEEDSQYTVWLRARNRARPSRWSSPSHFTTLRVGLASWVIAVITVVAVITTVVIVFIIIYSKREVAANLKKFRLQIAIPSGLLPPDPSETPHPGEGRVEASVSLNSSTDTAKALEHPRNFSAPLSRRLSLSEGIERQGRDVPGGREVPQGDQFLAQQRAEADDNLLNTATERIAAQDSSRDSQGFSESSGPASQPLLYSSLLGVGGKDASAPSSQPLSEGLQATDGGKDFVPPEKDNSRCVYVQVADCGKLSMPQVSQGYVAVQNPDFGSGGASTYIQLDASQPASVSAAEGSVIPPVMSSGYVGLEFAGGDQSDPSQGPVAPDQDPTSPKQELFNPKVTQAPGDTGYSQLSDMQRFGESREGEVTSSETTRGKESANLTWNWSAPNHTALHTTDVTSLEAHKKSLIPGDGGGPPAAPHVSKLSTDFQAEGTQGLSIFTALSRDSPAAPAPFGDTHKAPAPQSTGAYLPHTVLMIGREEVSSTSRDSGLGTSSQSATSSETLPNSTSPDDVPLQTFALTQGLSETNLGSRAAGGALVGQEEGPVCEGFLLQEEIPEGYSRLGEPL